MKVEYLWCYLRLMLMPGVTYPISDKVARLMLPDGSVFYALPEHYGLSGTGGYEVRIIPAAMFDEIYSLVPESMDE